MHKLIKSILIRIKSVSEKIRSDFESESIDDWDEEENIDTLSCGGFFSRKTFNVITGLCNVLFLGFGILPLIMSPGFIMPAQIEADEIFQGILVKSLFIGGIIYTIIAILFTLHFVMNLLFSKLKLSVLSIEIAITNGISIIPVCVALVSRGYETPIKEESIRIFRNVIGILISSAINLYFLASIYYFARPSNDEMNEEENSQSFKRIEIAIYEPQPLESNNQNKSTVLV